MAMWPRRYVSMKKGDSRATGGRRLASMIRKVDRPFLWIDTYNQRVDDVAGTIKARIDGNNMYFVSVIE